MKYIKFCDKTGAVRWGNWVERSIQTPNGQFLLDEVTVLPPTIPSKIIGVGLNYEDHAEEVGLPLPNHPFLFLIPPSSIAGHEDPIRLLPGKTDIEHEAELGIVISDRCRNISREDAQDVIKGFTCVNDVSNRDDQLSGEYQDLFRGKAFDNATPLGPIIATPDEVPENATVQLRVNGDVRQDSSRTNLIFSVNELIEEISTYVTLEPGDVIATGTPAGVSSLSPGDIVQVEIEGIGTLENLVKSS